MTNIFICNRADTDLGNKWIFHLLSKCEKKCRKNILEGSAMSGWRRETKSFPLIPFYLIAIRDGYDFDQFETRSSAEANYRDKSAERVKTVLYSSGFHVAHIVRSVSKTVLRRVCSFSLLIVCEPVFKNNPRTGEPLHFSIASKNERDASVLGRQPPYVR